MKTLIPLLYPNGYDIFTILWTFFAYITSENALFTTIACIFLYIGTRIGYCAGFGVRHILLSLFFVSDSPSYSIIGFLILRYGFQCIGIFVTHYEILSILGVKF